MKDDAAKVHTRSAMRQIPGGTFLMGSDRHYAEERPAHKVAVSGFRIDATTVTNADYDAFVAATGYVTVAERPIDPADYPGADARMLVPWVAGVPHDQRPRSTSTTTETGGSGRPAPAGATPKVQKHTAADPAKPSCCTVTDPRGPALESSFDPLQPRVRIPRRVVKGGSFLCAPNYCRRYRPAARHAQMGSRAA